MIGFTREQWEAVSAVDRHVLVTAGAGTGKTWTVVGRILYLLGVELNGVRIETPSRLHDLAAITFTNHAAADLKDKLRTALRESGRQEDAYLVDTARIGTIHSFCSTILREFALHWGRNPHETVLDETTANAIESDAVHDALLKSLDQPATMEVQQLLYSWSARDVERMVGSILEDGDRLRIYQDEAPRLSANERALVALASGANAIVDERLEALGAVDFDRIILRTRDLLMRDDRALHLLRRRLRTLIIDEFQDVDPVQKQIAYLLGAPTEDGADTTRLMLVGDPKQSIYRFRRADVKVWMQVERDFVDEGYGEAIELKRNFRSTAGILGFVDATIGTLFEEPANGVEHEDCEVRFQSLETATAKQRRGPPVELLVVPTRPDGRDYRADDVRKLEATAIARRASELVDNGEAGWSDMAVLVPNWRHVDLYKNELEAIGGRAFPLRTLGFLDRREIMDMILALEVARDPWDDRALFGYLRSPFVGVKDETLLQLARQGSPPYWDLIDQADVVESELLRWGMEVLRRHVALRDRVPTDELLESLLDTTGYLAHLRLLGEERLQAIANVDKLLRQARASSYLSIGEFLRVLEDAKARGREEGEVPLVPRSDAVTITTVHSAKGLEWNVVFWCDMVQWLRGGEGRDLLLGRNRVALKDPELKPEEQSAHWRQLKDEIEREVYAERKRIWYVAATRAAQRLFVCGLPVGSASTQSRNTVADHIWSTLRDVELRDGGVFHYAASAGAKFQGAVRLARTDGVFPGEGAADDGRGIEPLEVLSAPLDAIRVPAGGLKRSATEILTYSRCQRRHWFKYTLGVREPTVSREGGGFIDAVTRGTIVHEVLQWLNEEDELDSLLEDAIGRWDQHAPPPNVSAGVRYRKQLREEIKNVVDDPKYREIADLVSAKRELGFVHISASDRVFHGSMDLVAADERGLMILDVKTSNVSAATAEIHAARFTPQRDVYIKSAEGISGRAVDRFAFQFSQAGVQTSERIDSEIRKATDRRLEHALDDLAGGASALTAYPAECEFCGFRRVGWCAGASASEPVPPTGDEQLDLGLS
ncbi:MAG: UvrD-helicase domain-containing protein [Gemmatimonadales bacterium]